MDSNFIRENIDKCLLQYFEIPCIVLKSYQIYQKPKQQFGCHGFYVCTVSFGKFDKNCLRFCDESFFGKKYFNKFLIDFEIETKK